MPYSIPYDHPSLVLGNIVDPDLLTMLHQIGTAQAKIDTAQDKMNSFISMKRSLSMTINELVGMNVDVGMLTKKIQDIDKKIAKAANDYITSRISNEEAIQSIREKISTIAAENQMESPVDFERSTIAKLPLAADSLKLDAQYFSYGSNEESNPLATTNSIEEYVKESTAGLGPKTSGDIASSVGSQVNLQRQKHSLAGTLIITATCTHKKASLLSPLVLDVDKAIEVWNHSFRNKLINTKEIASIRALEEQSLSENDNSSLTLLSGVTLGSSFVGMVHVLNTESIIERSSDLSAMAANMQERLNIGGWIQNAAGGFGTDSSIVNDVKSMLSSQNITSHVTMVVMGAIPSIKANEIKMGVKSFAELDPAKAISTLAATEDESDTKTVKSAADEAKKGGKIMAMQGATIQSVIKGLGTIDHESNQTLDINSLMTAFQDYLTEIKKGDAGVPITFYFKKITQSYLAKLWINKYYSKEEHQEDKETDKSKSKENKKSSK